MTIDTNKLDNPVFHSLSETHHRFSINYGDIKFYHPDYCPFGGFSYAENIMTHIDDYSALCDNFFVVGNKPEFSSALMLKKELVCNQMIIDHTIDIETQVNIVQLTDAHANELLHLVNLVQPGYFKHKTRLLGNYSGIFNEGKLIAVTGERMKMDDFTEVSAVITHPDHTGKGYAKLLVAHTVNNIFAENKTPYLHVASSNAAAISLYEKLGFITRREISFWNLVKK